MAMPDLRDRDPDIHANATALPVVRKLRRHPFRLRHHPAAWELGQIDGKDVLLPQLNTLWLEPGCGLVRMLQAGMSPGEQYDAALALSEREGHTTLDHRAPIPAACLPAGVPQGGYLRAIDAQDLETGTRGVHHFERFNVPVESLPGDPQSFAFDREAYNRWRQHLVASGAIKPPLPQVVAQLKRRLGDRVTRAASAMWPTEHLREQRVSEAKAALDALEVAAKPAPKKGPKGSEASA